MNPSAIVRKLDDLLAACEKGIVTTLFAALVLLIVLNIVSRNLARISYPEALAAAPALVLWLALFGSTLALRRGGTSAWNCCSGSAPPARRRLAGVVTGLFGAAVMGLLFWASLGFVENEIALFGAWGRLSVIFPVFFLLSGFRYGTLVLDCIWPGPGRSGRRGARDMTALTLAIAALLVLALLEAPFFTVIAGLSAACLYAIDHDPQSLQIILIEMNRLASMPVLVALPLFTFVGCLLTADPGPAAHHEFHGGAR